MSHCIGIDLTAAAIRLVEVSHRRGKPKTLRTFTKPLEVGGLPADADAIRVLLSDLVKEAGFTTSANVVVGLPYSKVFFHSLRTDLADQEGIRRLLRFELEDDFPIPFDDLVADVCGHGRTDEGGRRYIVAAAARRELDPWVQALEASGRRSCVLSTDVCALEALARRTEPPEQDAIGVLVHADGLRVVLAVLRDGGLVCARHRSCTGNAETIAGTVANDIELTLRAAFRNDRSEKVRILLSGPDALCHGLAERLSQRTGHEVQRPQASSMLQNLQTPEFDGEFAIALGLALIALDPAEGRLNFLCADSTQVDRAVRSKTKQAAFVSVALLATILGLLGLRTVRELSDLETEHARLNREIRAIFVNAFPGEKKIVNELAQMTEHLNALRKQRNTLGTAVGQPIRPLWALQILSETIAPDKGIRVSSFVVKDKSIDVAGTGDSFESIERLLAKLREVPQFGSVELEDVASSRGSDRPEFRITISVKAG